MRSSGAAPSQVETLVLLDRIAVAAMLTSASALMQAATLEKVVLKAVVYAFGEDLSAKGVYSVYTADTKSRKGIRIKRNPDGLGCYSPSCTPYAQDLG